MAVMKTPGVYIVEKNAFPNSVVEVATAVPAFIGYTETSDNAGTSLAGLPFRISSLAEFERYYGGAPPTKFSVAALNAAAKVAAAAPPTNAAALRAAKALAAAQAQSDAATTAQAAAAQNAAVAAAALTVAQAGKKAADDAVAAAKGDAKTAAASVQDTAGKRLAQADADAKDANAAKAVADAAKAAADATLKGAQDASKLYADAPAPADAKSGAQPAAPPPAPAATIKVDPDFSVKPSSGVETKYALTFSGNRYRLYHAMRHFFQNGGGPCYIVSVGGYGDDPISKDELKGGIQALELEQEPTMVVIPDAVSLDSAAACIDVQQAMLMHCGDVMKNRVAILDVYDGYKDLSEAPDTSVDRFRGALGVNFLMFGAAYYPWVNTTIVSDTDFSYRDFGGVDLAGTFLSDAGAAFDTVRESLGRSDADWAEAAQKAGATDPEAQKAWIAVRQDEAHKALYQASPAFVSMLKAAARQVNLMAPSAAMAGLYTMVDNARGVWKAPANVSLNGVVSPAVNISAQQQQDLNVHAQGKSINAIRSFIGEGVLVWGARTLDGNSLDWRYINVRRTMIMLEESCRLAAKAMVFEPNVAGTWLTIKSMIQNFLTGIWRRGGLAGAVPEDAFSVHVGLGETMTAEDILEGILRVTVLVAVSRPAEFIEITFQQQMQKS